MSEQAVQQPAPPTATRTLVLHPLRPSARHGARTPEARLEEAVGLARAIDLEVAHAEIVKTLKPRPATLLGTGSIDRLKALIAERGVGLAIVDAALTPVQQRNLEKAWNCKVIDRTALILEIFGERARTREGRLQVELAHLTYQRSRLVRSWTHLERQRGGLAKTGGPGETQLEIDRRLIGERIIRIKRDLETVRERRALHRRARERRDYPVVALVGYTNAGKSTLFNRLTHAEVFVKDLLFATLDPTMREVVLPSGRRIILSDTVGFISDLPTDLVAAFRATLEEVIDADLIVHVRDISHTDAEAQREDVYAVLRALGLDEAIETSLIEALNKVDLLPADAREAALAQARRSNRPAIGISALTGEGCDGLLELVDQRTAADRRILDIRLGHEEGAAMAWLYDHGTVLSRRDEADATHLRVSLAEADAARFERRQAKSH
ncbi:MAG: GTPase HflX [Candidatus Eiseniibacteriota bacterium]